jgi:hypothetical protein
VRVQRMGSAGVGVGLVAAGICPMHGPIVKTSVAELVRKYRRGSASRRPGHCYGWAPMCSMEDVACQGDTA